MSCPLYSALRKILRNAQFVNGAAAKKFQKKAIGKFLITVPIQIAGRLDSEAPPRIKLNRIDAAKLIVGHITATVPPWRSSRHR